MRTGRKRQTKQAFAVVVDGETEYWYLHLHYSKTCILWNK